MAYGLADILKMAEGAGNDPSKYAILQGLMQGPGGGSIDAALRKKMGNSEAKAWLDQMHTQYGSTGGFDPSNGQYQYHDIGNPLEESTKEWQYKKGNIAGWDPSQFDPNQLAADMKTWETSGQLPGIQGPAAGPAPAGGPKALAAGGDPMARSDPSRGPLPLQRNVPGTATRTGTAGPPPTQMPGNIGDMVRQIMAAVGNRAPRGTTDIRPNPGAVQPGGGGLPPLQGPPPGGMKGAPPPGPGGSGGAPAGPSPYPNINANLGKNPATYTSLPMRGFDPSLLLRDMRQKFGAGGGAGQVHQMAPPNPQALQNNLQQWDQIFSRG